MNYWTTALSAHASDMSAWLFLSLPMLVWSKGASQVWIAVGLWVGMALNWMVVSRRLRERTAQAGCVTLPAWFHHSFNDEHGYLRWLCALLSGLFLLHYLAAGLIAMGLFCQQIFGLDYYAGTIIAALLITFYTVRGGFNAVALVDLFQALFLLTAIMIVPALAWHSLPISLSDTANGISSANSLSSMASLRGFSLNPFSLGSTHEGWQAAFHAFGWGLGYFGMPHVLSKFMGIKTPSELNRSMIIGMTWQALALGASLAIGIVAIGFKEVALNNPELLFIELVQLLFHPLAAGLIFCALMAANLSTMDSQLLVISSVASEDLLPRFFKKPTPRQKTQLFRLSMIVLAITAWLISCGRSPSVQSAVLYSWSGLGACYGPLVLWSLYSKGSHWQSGCLSLLSSASLVMIWPTIQQKVCLALLGQEFDIIPMIPGFFAGLLTLVLVEGFYLVRLKFKDRNYPEL